MTKWGESNGIEFWTMPLDRAEEALDVLRNGFFDDESFCQAVEIPTDELGKKELENLCLDTARDNISVMAVEKGTNKIVGVSYNKYQVAVQPQEKGYFEHFRDNKCKSKTAKDLISKMMEIDGLVDVYGKYDADCSAELMFLGTHKDYRRRGISVGCISASLELFRSLPTPSCPKRPPIVTSIFTSPWSIRAGRILKFDEIIHVSMDDIFFEGKPFSENPQIGKDHSGCILMVKTL